MLDGTANVPSGLSHDRFVVTPLTAETAALDHAAYTASPDVIRTHSDGRWPVAGFTLADDMGLVAQHEDDHRARRAFAFVLLDPSRTESLGCLYLNPLRDYLTRAGADDDLIAGTPYDAAMVTFWIRQDLQDTDLAEVVVAAVNDWLRDEWPLTTHLWRVLPGERSSRAALDRSGLQRRQLALRDDERPYLWYRPPALG